MPEDPVLARQVDAFLEASVTGRNGRAWRLLAEHPDIATFDFRTAVVLGDAGRVRELLAGDPALAVRPDDRSGWPPLLGVCSSRWHRIDPSRAAGMLAVARLPLEAGADPNSTAGRPGDRGYCSSLYAAAGCADDPAITELLLHLGAVPDDHTLYLTSFHRDAADLLLGACLRGDRAAARALVDAHPGLPGRLGADDHAAIVEAADRGWSGAVGLMLDLGFPIEARARNDGATVLHAAAAAGAAGLVRMLIERGADIEVRDTAWQATPLDWASVGSGLKLGRNPDPDWVGTVTTLLDAGADTQGAWVTENPPSSEVGALLRARGVTPPSEADEPAS